MSDIFISYDSADKERVRPLVKLLEERGWSVWWDRRIPPGKTFDEVIYEAIRRAKCILVIWSTASVKSRWVRKEAAEGDRRGILVPVLFDNVEIPFAFRDIQAAGLVNYPETKDETELRGLHTAIGSFASQPVLGTSTPIDERPETEQEVFTAEPKVTTKQPAAREPDTSVAAFLRSYRLPVGLVAVALAFAVGWVVWEVTQPTSLEVDQPGDTDDGQATSQGGVSHTAVEPKPESATPTEFSRQPDVEKVIDHPDVPQEFERFFAHYGDQRSMSEKALNMLGLSGRDIGRSFALVGGVDTYPRLPVGQRLLEPARVDMDKLARYLREQESFDEIVVLRNEDVTLENFAFFLKTYFPGQLRKSPNSRFLFAYSGHGTQDGKRGYLLEARATSFDDKANSIGMDVLEVFYEEIVESAHTSLALINASHSGAFDRFDRRSPGTTLGGGTLPMGAGHHVITSGGATEVAWHDAKIGPGSIFFEKFFAALYGRADLYPNQSDGSVGDGLITAEELALYLKSEVLLATDLHQSPRLSDISRHGSRGSFLFVVRETAEIALSDSTPCWSQEEINEIGTNDGHVKIFRHQIYACGSTWYLEERKPDLDPAGPDLGIWARAWQRTDTGRQGCSYKNTLTESKNTSVVISRSQYNSFKETLIERATALGWQVWSTEYDDCPPHIERPF